MSITFLPIQTGTGTPSPTNIRPIVAPLNITDIGAIYGGEFDTRTGVVTDIVNGRKVLDGQSSSTGANAAIYDTTYGVYGGGRTPRAGEWSYLYCDTLKIYYDTIYEQGREFPYMVKTERDNRWFYIIVVGLISEHPEVVDATAALAYTNQWLQEHNITILWDKATPTEYTLTTSQYAEALEQLHVPPMATELLERRAALGIPHQEHISDKIANFNTNMTSRLAECKCKFEPIQDLYGYANPWPAGGGRNLFHVGSSISKTVAGVVYTSNEDYIILNGTKNGQGYANMSEATVELEAGTYYAKAFAVSGTTSVAISIYANDGTSDFSGDILSTERTLTISETTIVNFRFLIATDGTVLTNYKIGIVVSKTSGIDKFYTYSNICPISGWTGANITHTGKNLFYTEFEYTDDLYTKRNGEYIVYQGVNTSYLLGGSYTSIGFHLPAGTYTLSASSDKFHNIFVTLDDDTTWESWNSGRTKTFTTERVIKNVRCNALDLTEGTYHWQLQIEAGSTATAFETAIKPTVYQVEFPATKNLANVATSFSAGTENKTLFSNTNDPLPVGKYTISFDLVNAAWTRTDASIAGFYHSGTPDYVPFVNIKRISDNASLASLTQPVTGRFYVTANIYSTADLVLLYFRSNSYAGFTGTCKNVQLESGAIATFYEPYGTIYGGYVDPIKGMVVAEWKAVQLKSQNWTQNGSTRQFFTSGDPTDVKTEFIGTHLCACYQPSIRGAYDSNLDRSISISTNRFWVRDSSCASASEFKAALSDDDIVVYELATPVEYQLTPQLIKAIKGVNSVFSDLNGNTTTKYWTH